MADVDDSQVYSAVMAMKEAVQIAIQLGDIQSTAVCKGTGMSTSQLHQWLNSRSQSAEWDTRVAEWLKRTQGQAAARAASTKSDGGSAAPKKKADKPAAAAASSSSSAAAGGGDPEVKKLNKLREDVRELEDYIPWNAVVPSWGGKRSAWARKLKESPDVQAVGQHLTALEAALVDHAMEPGWRGESRDEWVADIASETSAQKMRGLLREMEENIRWAAFKRLAGMHTQLKKLLASPSGALLKESAAVTTDYDGESLSAKLLKGRIDGFKCAPQLHNVPHILPLTLPISSHTSPYPSDHHHTSTTQVQLFTGAWQGVQAHRRRVLG